MSAGADQPDHLFDLFHQGPAAVVEQQVCFIKEEHNDRFIGVSPLRKQVIQLRQHPQQEGGVHRGIVEQPVRAQDVDLTPLAGRVHLDPVVDINGRFPEEYVAALVLQHAHSPLDGAHAGRGNITVFQGIFLRVLTHVDQQVFQILQVFQRDVLPRGHPERDIHHAALGLVQVQHPAHQQRTHVLHCRPDRNALFPVYVPVFCRIGGVFEHILRHAALPQPLIDRFRRGSVHDHAAQVALDIAQEHRNAKIGKAFRQHFQGYGLAGTRCAGDQAVAVCHGGQQIHRGAVFA